MTQILNIFRKDVRHHWLLMGLSLIFTVLHGFNQYSEHFDIERFGLRRTLDGYLLVFLPLCWVLLSVRLIHDEAPVGNKQFWTTRPYEWPRIIAAKALSILLFISAPMVLMQIVLLHAAGFHPSDYGLILLENCALLLAVIVLPAVALASVTRNGVLFSATVLIAFAVAMCGLGLADSFHWYLGFSPLLHPAVCLYVCIGLAMCVIVLQYARRTTIISRFLLVSAVTATLCWLSLPPKITIPHQYPALASGADVRFSIDTATQSPKPKPLFPEKSKTAADDPSVDIPLTLSSSDSSQAFELEGRKISMITADGSREDGGWETSYGQWTVNGLTEHLSFQVNRKFFESAKGKPVTIEVSLAVVRLHAIAKFSRTQSEKKFIIPRIGRCTPVSTSKFFYESCDSPIGQPDLTAVDAVWSLNGCDPPAGQRKLVPTRDWFGQSTSVGRALNLNVFASFDPQPSLSLRARLSQDENYRAAVCPEVPILYTTYRSDGRATVNFRLDGVNLEQFPQSSGEAYVDVRHLIE